MSTDIAKRDEKPVGLRVWMAKPEIQKQIVSALGGWMPSDTFEAHVLVAFQDEKVRNCTDKSKYKALLELAALTLLPTLGQVVLVPYKNEIKVTPQWQGLKALMERHPDILEVSGHLVHNTDEFVIHNGEMVHNYDPLDPARNIEKEADIRGGYCKIVYRDGRPPKYHFVTVKYITQCRRCAQTQNVWKAWYEQMAMKTLYRSCYARREVPIDPLINAKLEKAFAAEDLDLGNNPSRAMTEATEKHIEQAQQQRIEAAVEDLPPNDTVIDEPSPEPESQVEPEPDDDLEMELHALIGEYRDQANEKTALKHLDALATDAKGNEKFTTNGKLGTAAMVSALAKISEAKDRLCEK